MRQTVPKAVDELQNANRPNELKRDNLVENVNVQHFKGRGVGKSFVPDFGSAAGLQGINFEIGFRPGTVLFSAQNLFFCQLGVTPSCRKTSEKTNGMNGRKYGHH